MTNATNSGAVFFLGTRAHYQVLDADTFDSGNTSTETLYQSEELRKDHDESPNSNKSSWCYATDINVNFDTDTGVKKRLNRQTNEAVCEIAPEMLSGRDSDLEKEKPRHRFLAILSSLTRRKRRSSVHYLQHLENVLTTCTYRESCRCLDCQSRYFEYESETEDVTDDYAYSYTVQDIESQAMADEESDDEVFVSYTGDNTSTDLLIDDTETITTVSSSSETEEKQTQLEVAASTSAVLNVLLFHPACIVQ